jgi:hypothetical protein
MRRATHDDDSGAQLASSLARETDSGARERFHPHKSVTLMSQRDYEIGLRESGTKGSRGAARDLSRAFAGAASRLSAGLKKHEL